MKCAACDTAYDNEKLDFCPHCHFPPTAIYGTGKEYEEGRRLLNTRISEHCREYLSDVQIGIEVAYWKGSLDQVKFDRKELLIIASGPSLLDGPQFHPQKFARIQDKTLRLTVVVKKGSSEQKYSVNCPNLLQPDLQQIGVRIQDRLYAELILRNSDHTAVSHPFLL